MNHSQVSMEWLTWYKHALVGTWCIPELEVAVRKMLHDPTAYTKSGISSDGAWDSSDRKWIPGSSSRKRPTGGQVQRQAHVNAYRDREGIQLDASKIAKNPGQCFLAKMMLISMWGKFGRPHNKPQVWEFTEPQSFVTFLDSD